MQATQARSNSLTAHLARAGGAAESAEGAEPDEADDGCCTVSVMPGQHCTRPALAGRTVCAGHAAMGSK